jgi:hypothetical protein
MRKVTVGQKQCNPSCHQGEVPPGKASCDSPLSVCVVCSCEKEIERERVRGRRRRWVCKMQPQKYDPLIIFFTRFNIDLCAINPG